MTAGVIHAFDDGDIVKNFNRAREMVLDDLVRKKYLSQAQADRYLEDRVFVCYRPSWIGRVWSKIKNKPEDNNLYVEIVSLNK